MTAGELAVLLASGVWAMVMLSAAMFAGASWTSLEPFVS